jgi:hypothetical protein
MSSKHSLRCYDYINQPCERVLQALRADASGIFRRATLSSAARASAVGAQLHVQVGVLDVAADVAIELGAAEENTSSRRSTTFPLSWRSTKSPGLFPHMKAKLIVYPLTSTETQLELEGTYDPPLGLLGDAIDAVVGHRIAEASVLQFLQEISTLLRKELRA